MSKLPVPVTHRVVVLEKNGESRIEELQWDGLRSSRGWVALTVTLSATEPRRQFGSWPTPTLAADDSVTKVDLRMGAVLGKSFGEFDTDNREPFTRETVEAVRESARSFVSQHLPHKVLMQSGAISSDGWVRLLDCAVEDRPCYGWLKAGETLARFQDDVWVVSMAQFVEHVVRANLSDDGSLLVTTRRTATVGTTNCGEPAALEARIHARGPVVGKLIVPTTRVRSEYMGDMGSGITLEVNNAVVGTVDRASMPVARFEHFVGPTSPESIESNRKAIQQLITAVLYPYLRATAR